MMAPSSERNIPELADAVLLAIHPSNRLAGMLAKVAEQYGPEESAPLRIGLPLETRAISLPDGCVDEFYVPVADSYLLTQLGLPFSEFRRVLRPNSHLRFYYDTPAPASRETVALIAGWCAEAGFRQKGSMLGGYGWEYIFTC